MHKEKVQKFVQKFEECLAESFAELVDEIGFSLIIRNSCQRDKWLVSAEEYEWKGYHGSKVAAAWLDDIIAMLNLARLDSIEEIKETITEAVRQKKCLYFHIETDKKNSEIEEGICGGRQDIVWLVTGRQEGQDIKFLLEDVIAKTREVLNDLIYLSYWNNIEEHLFQAVKNKEGIRKEYIAKICSNAGILDLELLSLISARKYEKREVYSRIYFGEMPEGDMELSFDGKDSAMWIYCKNNLRFIRKMLEMTKEERVLVVSRHGDCQIMQGIALMNSQEGIQVIFAGYLKWMLLEQGKEILRYEEGTYHLQNKTETDELKKLQSLQLEDANKIKDISDSLNEQSHGTAAVFLDGDALEEELERLDENKRICRIKPISIINAEEEEKQRLKELIIGISAIDGALIADYQGNIHAIGAILDGESVVEADLSRGARYNSLRNYINWLVNKRGYERNQCFAVIVSEDGGMEIEIAGNIW